MSSAASGPSDRIERVAVGRVTHAHGVRGEVSVLVLTEIADRFSPGSVVRLEDGKGLTVSSSRPNRGKLLVGFEEIPDRTTAEPLAGAYLFIDAADVPTLPEGAYWPHELEGCEVVTDTGRSLGRIAEVISSPANDIWVARDGDRETLIPALKDVVLSVDVAARRVLIKEIPGLISEA
jgi:16S rRNA processing protein RimM